MNTEHPDSAPERHGTGRTRRRPTALVVSVATAAVLLVGGAGAYLGAGGQGESTDDPAAPAGARTPPPLVLDGWTGSGTGTGSGSGSGSGSGGIAPGEPDPSGARYVAAGELPEGPGSAPVYEPGAEVGRERVARLARALGMDGTPVAGGRSWRVGGQDGFGPSLTVRRDAPGGWTYSRYAPGTDDCRKVTVCSPDPGTPAGGPVSVADAERAAKPVLEAAGLEGARTDASRVTGGGRVVTADPVVGGLPTYGWTTGLTVGRGGELLAGHGVLAAPVKGDTYPVLGAARVLELMNGTAGGGHRAGIGGCASPVPLKDRLEEPCGASTGVPKRTRGTVTVDEAVFGLAAHSVGGRQTLVPSWLFRVRGAGGGEAVTVTYPAVDPAYLASASVSSAPAPSGKSGSGPVTSYSADGRRLSVRFAGGVCADHRVSARESGDRVTVTVTERAWPDRMCVMIAKEHVRTVTLDAPLNGRTVTGADGREIPEAAS
ncbi:hypothetical protein [Streptomyces sp. SudanB182_2057]|uniref:hypothetical protein n=1 Tax=Streptomyces sp. SudanB182_2057 TaxID=3035281 RepID=UPI003F54BC9C